MNILVQPISGGKIVVQIANYIKIRKYKYHPDIILGGSGGAACTSIILSSFDKDPNIEIGNILDKVSELASTYFLKKEKFPLSIIKPFICTHFYEKGEDIPDHIMKLKDKYPESYISTYNVNTGKICIFRQTNEKILKINANEFIDFYDINSFDVYKKVIRASCSIPGYLPPVKIDGSKYLDSGVITASPFNSMSSILPKESKIIYNCPFNPFIKTPDIKDASNVLDVLKGYIIETSTGHILSEIHLGILMSNYTHYSHGILLEYGMKIYRKSISCFMLIYPNTDNTVNLTSFTEEEIYNGVMKSLNNPMYYKIWYY